MSQGSLERRGSARCALGFEPSLCPAWHGRCFPPPPPPLWKEEEEEEAVLPCQPADSLLPSSGLAGIVHSNGFR